MNCHPLVCVVILLYTPYICGQYTVIWYDDMQQNNGWTPSGDVSFAYDSSSCLRDLCTRTDTVAWIRRSTDVSSYQSLRIKYSVGANSLDPEDSDECQVYSSYTSISTTSRTLIQSHAPPDKEKHSYPNNVVLLPDASSANTVYIWLGTCCDGSAEYCYWNDVSLEGILTSSPTPAPTTAPTPKPTLNPTPQPTESPTENPTTPAPTPPGTLVCGESDTGDYNGELLTFMVSLPHRGDIMFDASYSSFQISAMEATSELGTVLLDTDHDNDEIIRLYDMPPGNYKFSIYGGTVTNEQYEVRTWCASFDPTPAPSSAPTQPPISASTANPTKFPTIPPTKNPTKYPSIPTKASLFDTTLESGDKQNKAKNGTSLVSILIIMMGAAVIIFIWLVAIWFVYLRKKGMCSFINREKSRDAMKDSEGPKDTFAMRIANKSTDIQMMQGEIASSNAIIDQKASSQVRPMSKVRSISDAIANLEDEDDDDTTDSSVGDDIFGVMPQQKTSGIVAQCKDKVRDNDGEDDRFDEIPATSAVINIKANDPEPFGNNVNQPGLVVDDAGEADMGMCSDCTLFKKGRIYEGDSLFYCDQCWNSY